MKNIIFIDPLEKLVIKKDSSLLLAHELKEQGEEVYILKKDDFFIDNQAEIFELQVYKFNSSTSADYYLSDFTLKNKVDLVIDDKTLIHMRLEPPFDVKYMRTLWMLDYLEKRGVNVINSPRGILNNNEKLVCMSDKFSLSSYVGSSVDGFLKFLYKLKEDGVEDIILKPIDLFQGIGVEKLSFSSGDLFLVEKFEEMVKTFSGAIICQPFMKEIYQGEIRSIFFDGIEVGSIIKVPQKGSHLANIAQGATFCPVELSKEVLGNCKKVCRSLRKEGIRFVAFDILAERISEANVTCPGLLVEVSKAHERNLAREIVRLIQKSY